ncbi:pseudouridine synthase [Mycoplasmopsis columbinasalis]|uniref:Pseudouridine synthase n=1 Tax=Mycoplasmopsis columbinasalis TaxID=114880 RepID=A0A449B9M8_9BACT|nr:pseudouridine synthase [Mycoplasmopsis columbinasalis]VEU77863.1 ribosomal large subunit pseudouridine synthase B [Mycoplasmopsis columbinasalis]
MNQHKESMITDLNKTRLQKLIAASGYCSRREAEKLIQQGKVRINGQVAPLGSLATSADLITINNQPLDLEPPQLVYILLNKPPKTITTARDPQKRTTVVDLIDTSLRIVPVGRLDYDTTGALLLTNDLKLVNQLTHPKYEIQRIYRARLDAPLTRRELIQINKGILVNGKISHQLVQQVDQKSYLVTLHVGSYHHVKLLFAHFERKVLTLKRIQYANLTIQNLPIGAYRPLKLKELKDLKFLVRQQEARLQTKEQPTHEK